jgi:hypothetical protein
LEDFIGKRNLMVRLNLNDHSNIIDETGLNRSFASLGQNYPNPFSRRTGIPYDLADGSEVIFEIMDLTGRKVMVENQGMMPAGKHTFELENAGLRPGVYFYTLRAGSLIETRQMAITE